MILKITSAFYCLTLLFFSSSLAQSEVAPIILEGVCDKKSGIIINDETSVFSCDVAVIARPRHGYVLIHFADKSGDDGRIIGFGGVIEGKQGFGADLIQIMAVQRIYLASDVDPIPAYVGTCIMNWSGLYRSGGKLKSVACGGAGEVYGQEIKAIGVIEEE